MSFGRFVKYTEPYIAAMNVVDANDQICRRLTALPLYEAEKVSGPFACLSFKRALHHHGILQRGVEEIA